MPIDRQPAAAIEREGIVKSFGPMRALDGRRPHRAQGAITVLLVPYRRAKTVTIEHVVGRMQPSAGVAAPSPHARS